MPDASPMQKPTSGGSATTYWHGTETLFHSHWRVLYLNNQSGRQRIATFWLPPASLLSTKGFVTQTCMKTQYPSTAHWHCHHQDQPGISSSASPAKGTEVHGSILCELAPTCPWPLPTSDLFAIVLRRAKIIVNAGKIPYISRLTCPGAGFNTILTVGDLPKQQSPPAFIELWSV